MPVSKSFAGTTYQIPLNKDPKSTNWGTQVSNFLQALADYALPRTGGSNQLTAELNLAGSGLAGTYGIKLPYLKSATADGSLPVAGFLRLGNGESIQWKGSSSDLSLAINGSDRLLFNGTTLYQPADAASANTASKLVLRDASGDFSANIITAAGFNGPITGNAATATKWQTARTITLGTDLTGSVSLDGSADVTLNATIAANSVALGTDTTGDYVATISGGTGITLGGTTGEGAAVSVATVQDIASTASPTFAYVTLSNPPSSSSHAANKAYVDTVAQGLDVKASVKAATTANITLSGTQTIDGVALSVDDRVLVKNQGTQADNGFYLVKSSTWQRTNDADAWDELIGAFVFVEQGTTLADTGWVCTVNAGGTLGSTAITFSQFSGVGSYQPLDATLTTISNLTTTYGLMAYGPSDTVVPRTLTAGTGIGVTNGDGQSGNPTVAIDSTVATLSGAQNLINKQISSTALLTGALQLPAGTTAERPTPSAGYVRYNSDTSSFEGYASGAWSAIGGGGTIDRINQASHGFVVGDILYLNGTTYTKAIATAANTAEVVGMVSRVVDSSTFELTISGEVTGLTGLTAGEAYFLSPSSAGTMTITEPTTIGQISLPLGVASSTTSFYVTLKRGNVIGGTNARTQITLLNNTTANVQDVSAYDAGELTGWVSITNTTAANSLRFYVAAPFAKNGAASNWNISPSYMGDTPPSGFSLSITSAGIIQYTMPNVSGFSAANINYALNAPAVGATFPLSIDASTIQSGTITAARLPQVSTSSQGAFPSLITSLDNATATQLGLKQYYHGTNYNSGLAPTVTCSAAGFAVRRAVFIPYQTQDGQWRLRFNIEAAFNSVTVTIISLFVNGVVFKNINSQNEAMACCGFWGGLDSPIPRVYAFNSSTSSNEIAWRSGSAAGAIGVYGSGDVELESKPTWAY